MAANSLRAFTRLLPAYSSRSTFVPSFAHFSAAQRFVLIRIKADDRSLQRKISRSAIAC